MVWLLIAIKLSFLSKYRFATSEQFNSPVTCEAAVKVFEKEGFDAKCIRLDIEYKEAEKEIKQ